MHPDSNDASLCASPGILAVAAQLLWARDYARGLSFDPWQFAVEIDELAHSGLTRTDVRWLLAARLAEHREETTPAHAAERCFRPLAVTELPPRTCLLITDRGYELLRTGRLVSRLSCGAAGVTELRERRSSSAGATASGESHRDNDASLPAAITSHAPSGSPGRPDAPATPPAFGAPGLKNVSTSAASGPTSSVLTSSALSAASPSLTMRRPAWDVHLRELRVGGRLVKRFRVPAENQELILTTFEEDGWPDWIDDPLPPAPDIDPKRRLQATIKSLNRRQIAPLLRFHGNGGGSVIYWQPCSDADAGGELPSR